MIALPVREKHARTQYITPPGPCNTDPHWSSATRSRAQQTARDKRTIALELDVAESAIGIQDVVLVVVVDCFGVQLDRFIQVTLLELCIRLLLQLLRLGHLLWRRVWPSLARHHCCRRRVAV